MTRSITISPLRKGDFKNLKTAQISALNLGASLPKKTMFRGLFLGTLMLLLFYTPLLANENANLISILSSKNTSFILHLPQSTLSSTQMTLKNVDGTVLLSENIERGIEEKEFNLNHLSDGKYILSVCYANTTKWEHIYIQDGSLRVEEKVQTISKPTILLRNEFLDFDMLCFADAKVRVSIMDEAGHLLSREFFETNGNIQRRYNLKELSDGGYRIKVSLNQGQMKFEFDQLIYWSKNAMN